MAEINRIRTGIQMYSSFGHPANAGQEQTAIKKRQGEAIMNQSLPNRSLFDRLKSRISDGIRYVRGELPLRTL